MTQNDHKEEVHKFENLGLPSVHNSINRSADESSKCSTSATHDFLQLTSS